MYDGKQPVWARYGVALLAVAVACLVRGIVAGPSVNVPPYSCLCAAVCVAAWYGGLHAALFALIAGLGCSAYLYFHTRSALVVPDWETQVHASIYMVSGTAIALLGGAMHAARNHAEQLAAQAIAQKQLLEAEITTKEQAVQSLTKAHIVLGALMEYVPEGVILLGGPPDFPILANSRFGNELLGFPAAGQTALASEEYHGALGILMADGVTRPALEQTPLYRASRDGEIIVNEEWIIERPDGSSFPALFNVAPVRDTRGVIIGAVNCWHDITDRKRAEQTLRDLDRRKNDFLATLGHELRNPLASVLASVQTLNRIGSQQPDAIEMRGLIERQSLHMTRLIDDLLDASRISHGKISLSVERVDLTALVERTAKDQQESMQQRGVSLDMALPKAPLWVDGDPVRLSQIVANLLHNAGKFTDPGGRVTLLLRTDGGQAVIEVQDTGIGMEMNTIRSLFEPFIQGQIAAERSRDGLGLGLALVKGLVELHGGTVDADSEGPGHGSAFYIRLPLPTEPGPPSPQPAEPERQTATRQVLIIEDSPEVARSLSMLLKVSGHRVTTASDGASGIEMARQLQPDIILCDISMPGGMDGYDVARAIRSDALTKHACLVAITGLGQADDRSAAIEAGFDRHLTKPVVDTVLDALLADLPHSIRPITE